MNEILKEIYDNVLGYQANVIESKKIIDEDIQILLNPYRQHLTKEELDNLQNLLFSATYTAEHVGFENGVKFVAELLLNRKL